MSNRLFVKQLYLSAKPVRGVEVQYGGLPIVRGESTEITSYDNDGYLMGQRLTLSNPSLLDEFTITAAYLGDLRKPSVTSRWHRLSEVNYEQLLVRKNFGKHAAISAEFADQDGEQILRQALALRPLRIVDVVRLEAYEGVQGRTGSGFALSLEKAFHGTRFSGGYSDIDAHYVPINGDRYGRGERLFIGSATPLRKDVSLQVFATRAVNDKIAMPNRTRLDVLIRYDLAPGLRGFLPHTN